MAGRGVARAPCRVDLAGGTLDIWPLGLLHPGARTVNVAVDLWVDAEIGPAEVYRVRQGDETWESEAIEDLDADPATSLVALLLRHYDLGPSEVRVRSDSPRGAGLGASSALALALIGAAEAASGVEPSAPEARVHLARDAEARLMSRPTGCQDHYAALHGGALEVVFGLGGETARRLDVDLAGLAEHLTVVYTGQTHVSAENNWQVVRRRLDGEPEVTRLFDGICNVAARVGESLESADYERLGGLLTEEWELRRRLSPVTSTPLIEDLLRIGVCEGAWGGRACGAGGGGCVAFLAPPACRAGLRSSLQAAGGRWLDARPVAQGLLTGRQTLSP